MPDPRPKSIARATVLLTREPLQAAHAELAVTDPAAGAVVTFIGTTRNLHLDKPVLYLEYEAHAALAEKTLTALCADAIARFNLTKVCLHHRLGRLEIGEASVLIAVSSAHRAAAFDGCRYLIDTLKTKAPIWKKEYYADGTAPDWVGPDGKPITL